MSRRILLYVAGFVLLAVALLLGAWYWSTHFERVEEDVDLPRIGEITYNPLYVLGLSLRETGWTVDMRQRLTPDTVALGARDTVLLLNDPRRLSGADTRALLDFVEGGGHLVMRTPPPETFTPEANAALLEAIGVALEGSSGCTPMQVAGEDPHVEFCQGQGFVVDAPVQHAWHPAREEAASRFIAARVAGAKDGSESDDKAGDLADLAPVPTPTRPRPSPVRDTHAPKRDTALRKDVGKDASKDTDRAATAEDAPASSRFRERSDGGDAPVDAGSDGASEAGREVGSDDAEADADAGEVLVYARVSHGEGTVDVLADLDFLTNDSLAEPPHVTLTRQLFEPNHGAGTAHLLYAAEMPSLWRWLFENSWMAWGPALLALLAWLWARTARLGPLRPSPPQGRRSLMEHVTATGEHDWRYGQGAVLHAAAREAFLTRLRHRDPRLAALDGDLQARLLSERFGLPPDEIRQALSTPPRRDALALHTRIATLIRLRNQL